MYTVKRKNGENQNLTTLEQHFSYMERAYNFSLSTVCGAYRLRLFEKERVGNTEVPCVVEFHADTLPAVVSLAIAWIDDQQIE